MVEFVFKMGCCFSRNLNGNKPGSQYQTNGAQNIQQTQFNKPNDDTNPIIPQEIR